MNKTVHIAFGDSGYGVLKHFISLNNLDNDMLKNSVIMNLNEDYSLGPLLDVSTKKGLNNRIDWFNESFMNECYGEFDEYEKCGDKIALSYTSLSFIEKTDSIVIWHGKNTSDQIGLRYIISRFSDNLISEVDVTNTFKGEDYLNYCPISLAECDYEMVGEAIYKINLIDKEKRLEYTSEWDSLEKDSSTLRVFFDGVIESVDEDYYDKLILSNCSYNYKSAALIIGETMGRSNQLVCDTYIHCRVIKLINSGEILFRGDKSNLSSLEIKQNGSLREFLKTIFGENNDVDEDGIYHYLLENKDNELTIETTHISNWTPEKLSNKLIIDYNDENVFSLSLRINGEAVMFINNILVSNARMERFEYEEKIDGVVKQILEESIFIENANSSSETIIIKLSPVFTVGLI